MRTLTFKMSHLDPIIKYTGKSGLKFNVPYEPDKPALPQLLLVKDEGIYLMSGAQPRQMQEGKKKCVVAYAVGYDPDTDEDVWDKARCAVGGDDFAEALPIEWFTEAQKDGVKVIKLIVTQTSIKPRWTKRS